MAEQQQSQGKYKLKIFGEQLRNFEYVPNIRYYGIIVNAFFLFKYTNDTVVT